MTQNTADQTTRPIATLTLVFAVNAVVLCFLAFQVLSSGSRNAARQTEAMSAAQHRTEATLLATVTHMSLLMVAATGERRWLRRHTEGKTELARNVEYWARQYALSAPTRSKHLQQAQRELNRSDDQIISAVHQGQLDRAQELAFGLEYEGWHSLRIRLLQEQPLGGGDAVRLEVLRGDILHLDEVLTMSARLAAATGLLRWEFLYREAESQLTEALDAALNAALNATESAELKRAIGETSVANDRLVQLENEAFALVRAGNLGAASEIFESSVYQDNKRAYSAGMDDASRILEQAAQQLGASQHARYGASLAIVVLAILGMILAWGYTYRVFRRWSTRLERTNQRLQARTEELEQYTYRASHDLKAPLATVRGFARYVGVDIDRGNLQEASKNTAKISKLCEDLEEVIGSILDLTRADHLAGQDDEINFDAQMENLELKLEAILKSNAVELRRDLRHQSVLRSNELRIRQILENLVSNSIKYRDPAKKQQWVEVRTREERGTFVVAVSDNGRGIPAAMQDRVFTMFSRFHSGSRGSGLGLYLVHKHVEQLGGAIRFESSPQGTTFEVVFTTDHSRVKRGSKEKAA